MSETPKSPTHRELLEVGRRWLPGIRRIALGGFNDSPGDHKLVAYLAGVVAAEMLIAEAVEILDPPPPEKLRVIGFRGRDFFIYRDTTKPPVAGPFKTMAFARKRQQEMESGRTTDARKILERRIRATPEGRAASREVRKKMQEWLDNDIRQEAVADPKQPSPPEDSPGKIRA